jgi:outer membrane lipoprotein-sorting protein
MKSIAFVLSCAVFLFGLPAYAKNTDIATLMKEFASSKQVKVQFVERKYIRILDAPIESKGELLFQAPDRLEKRTIQPRQEILTIEGNKVSIERGAFKRSMSLDDFADMASLVKSLTATFRGDQAGIEQYFVWKLVGPMNKWELTLTPKTSKLFITLKEIRLSGDNGYVHTVETTLTDGDRSLMMLERP